MATTQIPVQITVDDSQLDKLAAGVRSVGTESKKASADFGNASESINSDTKKLSSSFSGLKGTIAAAFAIGTLTAAGKAIFDITARYESLQVRLKGVEGSLRAAQVQMGLLNALAAETPFSVEELTDTYIKLKQRGLDPNIETIRQFGDVSAAAGKSLDQFTEAVLDATTGEFERLKEFGIRAQKAGDQVTFTFKGQQTQVQFTQKAISDYLQSLSQLPGVLGATAAQSQTLAGRLATLSDNFNQFVAGIGNRLSGVFSGAIDAASSFLEILNEAFGPSLNEKLASSQAAFDGLFGSIIGGTLNSQQLAQSVATLNAEYGIYLPKIIEVDAATGKLNITEQEANDIRAVAVKLIREQIFEQEKQAAIAQANADIQEKTTKNIEQQKVISNDILIVQDRLAKGQAYYERFGADAAKRQKADETFVNRLIADRAALQQELNATIAEVQKGLDGEVAAINATVEAANAGLTAGQKQVETSIKERNAKNEIKEIDKQTVVNQKDILKAAQERLKLEQQIATLQAEAIEDELQREIALATVKINGIKQEVEIEKQQNPQIATLLQERADLEIAAIEKRKKAYIDLAEFAKTQTLQTLSVIPLDVIPGTPTDEQLTGALQAQKDYNTARLEEDKRLRDRQKQLVEDSLNVLQPQLQGLADTFQQVFGNAIPVDKLLADIETVAKAMVDGKLSPQNIANLVASVGSTLAATIGGVLKQQAEQDLAEIDEQATKQLESLEKLRASGQISEEQFAARKAAIEKQQEEKAAAIKRKQAEQQKALAIFNAILNTAAAVTAALTIPPPAGQILAGINAALGAAQIAAIAAQPIPKFKTGGLVKGPSHDRGGVMAELEGREFVQPVSAVQKYGLSFMEDIRTGRFKMPTPEFGQMAAMVRENSGGYQLSARELAAEIGHELIPAIERNKQSVTVTADAHGFNTHVRKRNSRIEYQGGQYFSR